MLREHLPELRGRYAIQSLGVFGSWARGEQGPASDLDVLVEFSETPGLIRYVELQQELSDLLGIRVDLVMRRALRPRIGRRIIAETIPV
ncbi:MAG TPA: nucleotidyltransferase family protein [Actinospica sp.]|nr:nucleotidyltransferase family protein [Actinospica sp.]